MKKRNKRYFEVKKEELLKKSSKIQNGSLDGEYIRKEERDEQLYSKEPDSSQVQSTLSNDDTDVQLKKSDDNTDISDVQLKKRNFLNVSWRL